MKRKYSSPELDIRKYDFPSDEKLFITTSGDGPPDLNDGDHYNPFG